MAASSAVRPHIENSPLFDDPELMVIRAAEKRGDWHVRKFTPINADRKMIALLSDRKAVEGFGLLLLASN